MAINNFNTARMQLWQIDTFLNYPLNVHISYVHICRCCPSPSMTKQKCQGWNLIQTRLKSQYVTKCETACAPNANSMQTHI